MFSKLSLQLVNRIADLEIEMETTNLTLKTKDIDQHSSQAAEAAGNFNLCLFNHTNCVLETSHYPHWSL